MPPPDIIHEPPAVAAPAATIPDPVYYKILSASRLGWLETMVNNHVAKGYKLAGGVAVGRNDTNTEHEFYQAVSL